MQNRPAGGTAGRLQPDERIRPMDVAASTHARLLNPARDYRLYLDALDAADGEETLDVVKARRRHAETRYTFTRTAARLNLWREESADDDDVAGWTVSTTDFARHARRPEIPAAIVVLSRHWTASADDVDAAETAGDELPSPPCDVAETVVYPIYREGASRLLSQQQTAPARAGLDALDAVTVEFDGGTRWTLPESVAGASAVDWTQLTTENRAAVDDGGAYVEIRHDVQPVGAVAYDVDDRPAGYYRDGAELYADGLAVQGGEAPVEETAGTLYIDFAPADRRDVDDVARETVADRDATGEDLSLAGGTTRHPLGARALLPGAYVDALDAECDGEEWRRLDGLAWTADAGRVWHDLRGRDQTGRPQLDDEFARYLAERFAVAESGRVFKLGRGGRVRPVSVDADGCIRVTHPTTGDRRKFSSARLADAAFGPVRRRFEGKPSNRPTADERRHDGARGHYAVPAGDAATRAAREPDDTSMNAGEYGGAVVQPDDDGPPLYVREGDAIPLSNVSAGKGGRAVRDAVYSTRGEDEPDGAPPRVQGDDGDDSTTIDVESLAVKARAAFEEWTESDETGD